jgi:hypothetical protein
MNTIYQLKHPRNFTLDGFATNDEELRWLAINYNRSNGLKVRVEIDWEDMTVTVIPLHDSLKAATYDILKTNRATQEGAQ